MCHNGCRYATGIEGDCGLSSRELMEGQKEGMMCLEQPEEPTMSEKFLTIMRCDAHKVTAIAIERKDGSGRRLTPEKCCGSWVTKKRWTIDALMLEDIKRELIPEMSAPDPLAERMAEALRRSTEWIEKHHEMPGYSEMLLLNHEALAAWEWRGKS